MDWLLDTRREDATAAAVTSLEDYLARHAYDTASVQDAVDAAMRTMGAGTGLVWLHLDWTGVLPRLTVRDLPEAAAADLGSGFSPVSALDRAALSSAAVGAPRSIDLTVPREVLMNFDPDPAGAVELDPIGLGAAATAVALAAAAESHPVATPDQVAAAAGAMLADASLAPGHRIDSPDDVVSAFGRLHEALGGGFRRVPADGDRIELLVDRSPFGPAICQIPSLARLSEAMVGRIAARLCGRAVVVHDESLGQGDPTDRIQVLFGEVGEDVCGSTYLWPPAGTHDRAEAAPRLEMTVSLPRQSHSVPVIRQLAAQILRAFGVAASSIHDVELAISEACANVIQHALDSEGYEVGIELAADRCAITVLDRGEGFDASQVHEQDDIDAESGRGLSLMAALVDNLNFVSEPKVGAVVHMVKQLDYDRTHPFHRTGAA